MGHTSLVLLLFIVCLNVDDVLSQADPLVTFSDAANCFSLNLYKQLVDGLDNVVCSPYGADVLLSMLLVGAQGTTAEELNKTLGYCDPLLSLIDMEDAFKTDLASQISSDGNTLIVSNSLWIQKGNTLKEEYYDIVTLDFYATQQSLDFAGDPVDSTDTINDWVNNQTKGLIPTLFDKPLDSSTLLVLVNTIYMNASWKYPFNKNGTYDETFYNNGSRDDPVPVPFMHQTNSFNYKNYPNMKAQLLKMDYNGGDLSMVFILPYESSSLNELETDLDCTSFQDDLQTPSTSTVSVTLPIFTVESSFKLNTALSNLGIDTLFDVRANLPGIAPGMLVSEIIQKAVIKVKENGTEASAATAVVIKHRITVYRPKPPPPIIFKANRPFIYFIWHKPTNIILFMGRIQMF